MFVILFINHLYVFVFLCTMRLRLVRRLNDKINRRFVNEAGAKQSEHCASTSQK